MGVDALVQLFRDGMARGHTYVVPKTSLSFQLRFSTEAARAELGIAVHAWSDVEVTEAPGAQRRGLEFCYFVITVRELCFANV